MTALPPSFAHPSINLPDIGGVTPLSEEEISALSYAAWRQHLDEVAGVFELERAEQARKAAEAQQAQDRLEGKALTRVLNRLGFPIADLPSNVYRAPDGILFALSAYREGESEYNAISAQPVASQEPDHFYLRVMYTLDVSTDDAADVITAYRVFGDNRRMTAKQITNIQAALPYAIAGVKDEVQAEVEARARRVAALAAADKKVEEVNPVPQFRTEFCTLDQGWEHGDLIYLESHDTDLADMIDDGWTVANIGVTSQGMGVLRVVTLTRQVAVEAVQ